ncbi:hypothetical protein [Kitasatospora sp. NPDC127116]|uniref:hypothetical protein n=1 Tax=Kitasatospora sp. NPDC127116 TaxID=3345367 RepID=UPI00362B8656
MTKKNTYRLTVSMTYRNKTHTTTVYTPWRETEEEARQKWIDYVEECIPWAATEVLSCEFVRSES